ncbi:YceG family protein [Pontibacillus sp. ALD_SL1]|uniref:YceG family protein n=1 Tax=Pontibacillus sp. ALD_SL1 TaxID=2777185 RepID=UPI001A96F5B7|nr:YceG family protein [Pontibacillus sp. ALD_SL1]QSS99301.1 YceG family protein [Pontibacillus sp. ALD_SL1]
MTEFQNLHSTLVEGVKEYKWKEPIQQLNEERDGYGVEEKTLYIPQYVAQVLGITEDEDEYYNEIYDLTHDEAYSRLHSLNVELNKQIDSDTLKSLQELIKMHQQNPLTPNRFVAFLDGKKILPRLTNTIYNKHIRKVLMEVLSLYGDKHAGQLKDPDFQRVIVDLIKWTNNHVQPWMDESVGEGNLPKVLWYGDATKSQTYFLYYLYRLGFDLVLYHPAKLNIFERFDLDVSRSIVVENAYSADPLPFPTERKKRSSTVAYKASKQIERAINHDNSQIYKPWQFREYIPASVTMKTTYDEIFILSKEKAFVRPNFYIEDQTVHIPSIFAKVVGVTENRNEYWSRVQQLLEEENAHLVKQFPFTDEIKGNYLYHYRNSLNGEGKLDASKIMEGNFWQYKHLPDGLQRGIAQAIIRLCEQSKLLSHSGERAEDVSLYLFKQGTQMPDVFMRLLQKFDYSQDVPKVILYNNEYNGELTRSDAVLLLLLHELGVDLVLYSPTGNKDLEQYVDDDVFDLHMLDDIVFDLEFKQSFGIKDKLKSRLLKLLGE